MSIKLQVDIGVMKHSRNELNNTLFFCLLILAAKTDLIYAHDFFFLTGQYSFPSFDNVKNKGVSYSVFISIKYKKKKDVNHFLLLLLVANPFKFIKEVLSKHSASFKNTCISRE
jgi:hypothetical protein